MFRLLLQSHLRAEPYKCYIQLAMLCTVGDLVYMLLLYIVD